MIKFAPGVFQEIISLLKPSFTASTNKNPYGESILISNKNTPLTFRANNYQVESKVVIPNDFNGIETNEEFEICIDNLIYQTVKGKDEVIFEIDDGVKVLSGGKEYKFSTLDPDYFHLEVVKPDPELTKIVNDLPWFLEAFQTVKSGITNNSDMLGTYCIRNGKLYTTDEAVAWLVNTEDFGESNPSALDLNPILNIISRSGDCEVFTYFTPPKCSIMVSREVDCWYTFNPIEGTYPNVEQAKINHVDTGLNYTVRVNKNSLLTVLRNFYPFISKAKQMGQLGEISLKNKDKFTASILIPHLAEYEEEIQVIEKDDKEFEAKVEVKDLVRLAENSVGDIELNFYSAALVGKDLGNVNVEFLEMLILVN